MRLHLSAEDLDASLEDDSSRALRQVPNAVQEACSVKVSLLGLVGCTLSQE